MEIQASACPALTWQGPDLPHIPPGNYQAACIGWQGPEWVRAYRRWSIRLEFVLLTDETVISAFYNLGNDAAEPHMGRRSRFYTLWCLANGEPPRRGQRMDPKLFVDPSLQYLVRVADAVKDGRGELKPNALIYSQVADVLNVERS
jgi:hypothetical protein